MEHGYETPNHLNKGHIVLDHYNRLLAVHFAQKFNQALHLFSSSDQR